MGASSGMGQAVAQELAAEGARVAVTSRSADRGEFAAAAIGARAYVANTEDGDGLVALADAVRRDLGPIEILVTNTGGPPASADALAFDRADWEAAYRTLVLAPMALIEQVVPSMRAGGFGRIVNISSTAVREPIANLMLSNVHRSATLAAFKTLARRLAPDGITLNTVLPGRIATDRLGSLYGGIEQAEAAAATDVPIGRLGGVAEFAAMVTFLCSERAGYVTGAAIPVDGGLMRSV